MSKARDLSDFISVATVDASEIADLAITHAKLHTDMNLSGKTVTLPSAITNTITNKLPLAGGTLTGNITIDSSASASLTLDRVSTNAGSTLDFKTAGALKWYMGLRGLSNDSFYIRDEVGNTDALTITSGGNVGIGIASPDQKLQVKGVIETQATNSTNGWMMYTHTDNTLRFNYNGVGSDEITALSDGKVGIGTTNPTRIFHVDHATDATMIVNAAAGNQATYLLGEGGTSKFNMSHVASGDRFQIYNYYTNSASLTVNSSGYVGIGNTGPVAPLHIQYSNNDGGVGGQLIKNTNTGTTANFSSVATQAVNGTVNGTFGTAHYNAWGGATAFAGSQTNHPFALLSNNTVKMTVLANGNIGIGIGAPAYKLDVGGTTEVQARLKSSGGTGWTQGALLIESSDSSDNAGNRGQGVYMYNVPNQRTWYTGTLYNNGNKFGIGYRQAAGFQHIAADNSKSMLVIDGDTGVTMPDRLQPNAYWPVLHNAAITGTFNASGAGINAWHAITNFNFNNAGNSQSDGGRGHDFLIYWTSGNVSRGYNHAVSGHIPYMGANAHITYQGNSYLTSGFDSSHPHTGLINVSHHTAPTSGHDIRVRVHGNGTSYGPLQLQIWAEATPNAANAKISIWRV